MSLVIEGHIQLLRYDTRPYIWIPPSLMFTLVQFDSSLLFFFKRSNLTSIPPPHPIIIWEMVQLYLGDRQKEG